MSDRAVSEVVSYVLVFALIVSAVGIVSVSGLSTLQDTRNDEQMDNAERAFDVLADNLADIHRRDAPSRATEISLSKARMATGDNVTMNVSVYDGEWNNESWEIRPIVYTGDEGRQLVYEAGAVFRTADGDAGVRVHDPPFVVSNDRLLISVVGLNRPNRQALAGSTVLIRANNRGTTIPYDNGKANVDNITVSLDGTDQPGLWKEYFQGAGFEDCTGSSNSIECTYPPSGSIDQVYVVHHDIAVSIES